MACQANCPNSHYYQKSDGLRDQTNDPTLNTTQVSFYWLYLKSRDGHLTRTLHSSSCSSTSNYTLLTWSGPCPFRSSCSYPLLWVLLFLKARAFSLPEFTAPFFRFLQKSTYIINILHYKCENRVDYEVIFLFNGHFSPHQSSTISNRILAER